MRQKSQLVLPCDPEYTAHREARKRRQETRVCCSASEPTSRPPLCRTCHKRNRRKNAGAIIRTRAVDRSQGPALGSAGIELLIAMLTLSRTWLAFA